MTNNPEALSELHRSQESAYNLRDSARADHLTRAKICTKIIKYPHVEDYSVCHFRTIIPTVAEHLFLQKHALKEHDEKQLYLARQHVIDLRNIYAVITDILHKNINKVNGFLLFRWHNFS